MAKSVKDDVGGEVEGEAAGIKTVGPRAVYVLGNPALETTEAS